MEYYFMVENGKKIRVCGKFFVATLTISRKIVAFANKDRSPPGASMGTDERDKHALEDYKG